MKTLEQGPATGSQDIVHKGLTMAMAILVERIRSLSEADKQDLFELTKELPCAESEEEFGSIAAAMQEILEQKPIRVKTLELPKQEPAPSEGLARWTEFVSGRIKSCREEKGLTQAELAEKSGLPQSHISRLERGKHSPSRVTIEKIARALGRDVGDFDPSA